MFLNRPAGPHRHAPHHPRPPAGRACQALLKIVLFDVNLALDTYFHADKRRREQLHAALNAVLEVVFLFRPDDLQIVYANHGAAYTLGYGEEELQTMTPLAFMAGGDEAYFRTAVARLVDGKETFTRIDTNLLRKNDGVIPAELFLQHIKAAAGPGLVVGIARDVSEHVKHQEMLEHMALHDPLTELANRRMLHREVEKAIAGGHDVALLFIGLDRFRIINETIGYSTGDMVLLKFTERLKLVQAASSDYLLSRVGGDVFAILAPCAAIADAMRLARDCQAVLGSTLRFGEFALDVQSTIGIALYPSHAAGSADELLRQAGVAMQAARRTRTDAAAYSSELEKYRVENLNLAGELRRAIGNDELTLYYQPKIDMKSGRITSVEALVRWIHPERGFLPPDLFIPLAEESALIYGLTEWVMRHAMQQQRRWLAQGLPDDFRISVNVTAADLENASFVETIHRLGQDTGSAPGVLVLEITESGLMHDPERVGATLHRLRDIGIQLSIDDFGTGYSSLSYLKDLPVQELKIDHSFVRHMLESDKNAAIVHATVTLAHDLGLRVVAEGVEDEAIWNRLADLGCDKAQGYYMGKPMPAEAFEDWLRHSPWGLNPR